jgi:hypothetical protein
MARFNRNKKLHYLTCDAETSVDITHVSIFQLSLCVCIQMNHAPRNATLRCTSQFDYGTGLRLILW